MLITIRSGAYCSTTLVGCNIRKYDGLPHNPVPELDDENPSFYLRLMKLLYNTELNST